jgi:phospholipase/lecithinase/hemolysin
MKRLILIALALGSSIAPAPAAAAPWTSVVAFGDSLSDSGNAALLTGAFFPPSPPYAFRFSNGPTAVEILAQQLGLSAAPSVAGGTNHAVGGATTGMLNFNFEIDSPPGLQNFPALATSGMLAQVATFLSGVPPFEPATTLFWVWGGPNDLFLALAEGITDPSELALVLQRAVENLAAVVAALATAGGQHFVVANMANMGQTPDFRGTPLEAALAALIVAFDGGLASAMAELGRQSGLDIAVFDTFALFERVVDHPPAFGFTNATTPCLASPVDVLAGCPGFVFFDGVHPTTAAHRVLADAVAQTLVPWPSGAVLLAAGLAVAMCARRRPGRVSPRT